jgi:hypothetical protein
MADLRLRRRRGLDPVLIDIDRTADFFAAGVSSLDGMATSAQFRAAARLAF